MNRILTDVKNYDYDRQIFPVMQNLYRKRALADDVCDFFGDWRNFEGYSDIGYYLGAEVVRYASKVLDADS